MTCFIPQSKSFEATLMLKPSACCLFKNKYKEAIRQVNYCKIETLLKIETNIPEKFKQHLQYSLLKKNSLICYQNQKKCRPLGRQYEQFEFRWAWDSWGHWTIS